MNLKQVTICALLFTIFFYGLAITFCYSDQIDMDIIKEIESSGNPLAYNWNSKAIGLYQITNICLKDYNTYHKKPIRRYELILPNKNFKVAHWYLNKRIPQMLKYYDKPVTETNILIAYNYGIGNLVKGGELPDETTNYIRKYRRLKNARTTN